MAHVRAPAAGKRALVRSLNAIFGSRLSAAASKPMNNEDVRRILVAELWNIGDVVLLVPFLMQLRAIFPRAKITLLAKPHARTILEGTGLADDFIHDGASAENWLSLNPLERQWGHVWHVRKRLRERQFDIAFQCRLHVREHVLLAMSGARRRVGYAFGASDTMLTDPVEVGDLHRHKTEDWLRLLTPFGGAVDVGRPELCISVEERRKSLQFLADRGIAGEDILIGIHPGASHSGKRWPLDRFREVARELSGCPGCRVIAFVDPAGYGAELDVLERVVAVRGGLREMMALIERCEFLVCNDSGPMHLAAALGVPTVALFDGRVARSFAPLGGGHELITGESDESLQEIPLERVLKGVNHLMSLTATPPLDRAVSPTRRTSRS